MAALMAVAPSFVAGTPASEPPNDPIGVLTAETITTSFMIYKMLQNLKAPNLRIFSRARTDSSHKCPLFGGG
jgi:hypothetical protein